jgi:hypothetical protein
MKDCCKSFLLKEEIVDEPTTKQQSPTSAAEGIIIFLRKRLGGQLRQLSGGAIGAKVDRFTKIVGDIGNTPASRMWAMRIGVKRPPTTFLG